MCTSFCTTLWPLGCFRPVNRLQHNDILMDWDSLMDCHGDQEEPEGRPGGAWDLTTARGVPPSSFTFPWSSWSSFWLFLGSLAIHQAIPVYQAILMLNPRWRPGSVRTFCSSRLAIAFLSPASSRLLITSLDHSCQHGPSPSGLPGASWGLPGASRGFPRGAPRGLKWGRWGRS